MDVKEAVKKALCYIKDIFGDENPENIGLEEVVFNDADNMWEVTVGFSRPWDYSKGGGVLKPAYPRREYKVVLIEDDSKEFKGIKIRELKHA